MITTEIFGKVGLLSFITICTMLPVNMCQQVVTCLLKELGAQLNIERYQLTCVIPQVSFITIGCLGAIMSK